MLFMMSFTYQRDMMLAGTWKRERTRYKGGKGRAGYHPHPLAQLTTGKGGANKLGAFTQAQAKQTKMEDLRSAIKQYCDTLNDYFAGQELHLQIPLASKFMRAYYMHAKSSTGCITASNISSNNKEQQQEHEYLQL